MDTYQLTLDNIKLMVSYQYYKEAVYTEFYKGQVTGNIREPERVEILEVWDIEKSKDIIFSLSDDKLSKISQIIYDRFYSE